MKTQTFSKIFLSNPDKSKKSLFFSLLFLASFLGVLFVQSSLVKAVEIELASLVINEIDYDQPGEDVSEFLELKNIGSEVANLNGYELRFVNGNEGSSSVYKTISLPDVGVPAGAYFVVCKNQEITDNCSLEFSGVDIQNGAPDSVALFYLSGDVEILIDTLSYEGDVPGYTEGTGTTVGDDGSSDGNPLVGLSRYPDGNDTDNNDSDFVLSCITPGGPNVNSTDCENPPVADEVAPSFSFINPTPDNESWINYTNPIIKIEADERLSKAHLNVELVNGGFEDANMLNFSSVSSYWQLDSSTKKSGSYSARSSQYIGEPG